MLRPIDIHKVEFKHAFRGYNVDEVDEYLEKIVVEYEAIYKENAALKERIAELQKQADSQAKEKETLQETLEFVRQTALETKAAAEKNAERIVASAQAQAKEILAQAKAKIRQEELAYQELSRKAERFRQQFREFLERHLAELTVASDFDYPSESPTRVFTALREVASGREDGFPDSGES